MAVTGDFDKLRTIASTVAAMGKPAFKQLFMKRLAGEAMRLVHEGFAQGTDPQGQPWKRAHRGGRTLRDTGRLLGSYTAAIRPDGFTLGTNLKYAGVHQFGAVIKPVRAKALAFRLRGDGGGRRRFGNLVFAKRVVIPRRQMVPEGTTLGPIWARALETEALDLLDELFASNTGSTPMPVPK